MTTNQDVLGALRSMRKALQPGGILIFDHFDASAIFTNFQKRTREDIRREDRRFIRLSERSPNLATGWTWNWEATYVMHDGRPLTFFFYYQPQRAMLDGNADGAITAYRASLRLDPALKPPTE